MAVSEAAVFVLRTMGLDELPDLDPGTLPDCMTGRAPVTSTCCAYHQVDWARAVRLATWAWYMREPGESACDRMARADVDARLLEAAVSLFTQPIELAMDRTRPTGYAQGRLRVAAMRQQRARQCLVQHEWPEDEPVPGELLDPEGWRR